jgi:DnaK suppressor protein
MDADLRSVLLENLIHRKKELDSVLSQARRLWREQGPGLGAQEPADEVDGALCEASTHNLCSLIERKSGELRKVDDLIRRMAEDEEFGLCEECGEPIPAARLMVLPDATLCVPCQSRQERSNGLRRAGTWRSGFAEDRRRRDWEDPDIEENAIFDTAVDLPAMQSEGKPSKMFLDDLG